MNPIDPTQRFSGRAADYRSYRPGYPPPLLDLLKQDLRYRRGDMTAIDIGAGTGISSEFLASGGWHVIAVEPNDNMRQNASHFRAAAISFVSGTAESTGLTSGCADLVTSFQSFHWFRPERALAEFHRLLHPGGRAALIWNIRDSADPFTAAYSRIIEEHAGASATELQHKEASGRRLLESPLFTGARRATLSNSQTMNLDALLGRVRSTSYLPNAGPAYDKLACELSTLFARFAEDGKVHMIYQTIAFLAERP